MACLPVSHWQKPKKWVIFDMDSTVIETEVIDELAVLAGTDESVAKITAQAMRGEIDFETSFRERMQYLKKLDYQAVKAVATRLPVTPGLADLLPALKEKGVRTGIISGGFDLFAEQLKEDYGFDRVIAHTLEVEDGVLTGGIKGEVIDGVRKRILLEDLLATEGVTLDEVVVVGDGANDIPMLQAAGLGIAYRAKPKVNDVADVIYSSRGIEGVLAFV